MNWLLFAAICVLSIPVIVWRIRRAVAVEAAIRREIADWDLCELLWDMPAYDPDADGPELDAGCDRLRAAIRDEQQKGEQA